MNVKKIKSIKKLSKEQELKMLEFFSRTSIPRMLLNNDNGVK